ncbi:hypothetical protein [Longimicrobium sp.]|uniref:hypothetical protein n=1 Tax=Longimicrobium sp. TaxID=2029185 RepID=UPI003B3B9A63
MQRWTRIAAVTAGLSVAGAVFGTITGMAVLLAWNQIGGGDMIRFTPADLSVVLQASMLFGGGLGAVLGPLSAWVLMRHVPLGVAVGGSTLGTLVSGGIGLLVTADPVVAMFYGMAGFGISTIALRSRYPRGASSGAEKALADPGPSALIS